jgi:hypothetical protein
MDLISADKAERFNHTPQATQLVAKIGNISHTNTLS